MKEIKIIDPKIKFKFINKKEMKHLIKTCFILFILVVVFIAIRRIDDHTISYIPNWLYLAFPALFIIIYIVKRVSSAKYKLRNLGLNLLHLGIAGMLLYLFIRCAFCLINYTYFLGPEYVRKAVIMDQAYYRGTLRHRRESKVKLLFLDNGEAFWFNDLDTYNLVNPHVIVNVYLRNGLLDAPIIQKVTKEMDDKHIKKLGVYQ